MKALLTLSLLFNLILGVLYFQETQKPPLERIVVEQKTLPSRVRTVTKKILVEKTISKVAPVVTEKKYEEAIERVASDKDEFLREQLELPFEKLEQIEQVKGNYEKKIQELLKRHPMTLGLEQRRKMLEYEEQRDVAYVKIFGKSKWEKFQKFKDDYNNQKFKDRQDFGVVVPLDL